MIEQQLYDIVQSAHNIVRILFTTNSKHKVF